MQAWLLAPLNQHEQLREAALLLVAGHFEVDLLSPIELFGELEFPCEVVISRLAKLGARRL
jgi:hypothetical protein